MVKIAGIELPDEHKDFIVARLPDQGLYLAPAQIVADTAKIVTENKATRAPKVEFKFETSVDQDKIGKEYFFLEKQDGPDSYQGSKGGWVRFRKVDEKYAAAVDAALQENNKHTVDIRRAEDQAAWSHKFVPGDVSAVPASVLANSVAARQQLEDKVKRIEDGVKKHFTRQPPEAATTKTPAMSDALPPRRREKRQYTADPFNQPPPEPAISFPPETTHIIPVIINGQMYAGARKPQTKVTPIPGREDTRTQWVGAGVNRDLGLKSEAESYLPRPAYADSEDTRTVFIPTDAKTNFRPADNLNGKNGMFVTLEKVPDDVAKKIHKHMNLTHSQPMDNARINKEGMLEYDVPAHPKGRGAQPESYALAIIPIEKFDALQKEAAVAKAPQKPRDNEKTGVMNAGRQESAMASEGRDMNVSSTIGRQPVAGKPETPKPSEQKTTAPEAGKPAPLQQPETTGPSMGKILTGGGLMLGALLLLWELTGPLLAIVTAMAIGAAGWALGGQLENMMSDKDEPVANKPPQKGAAPQAAAAKDKQKDGNVAIPDAARKAREAMELPVLPGGDAQEAAHGVPAMAQGKKQQGPQGQTLGRV